MVDKELEKELQLFNQKRWTEESTRRLCNFLDANKWSITRSGHKFVGSPSVINTMPMGYDEPLISIRVQEDQAQIEITAPLSQFTREQTEPETYKIRPDWSELQKLGD